ncbi:hypothetical protein KUTeg_019612 [Tegillarca granosa]|uniref:Short-chain collagen C4-like n=1 Tax=Tegillarca granosa TaxID=220873 RepID=A0ABQ9ECZ4_TEGGR|nr:hypothetical protein KUTeg_019612 [Tegillarca granosa]
MRELNALKAEIANLNATKAENSNLNANLNAMKAEMSILKSTVSKQQNGGSGAVFTRWGKRSCPGNSTQIYAGFMAGSWYDDTGSGSNFLCLPTDPLWGHYNDRPSTSTAHIYGTEYQTLEFAPTLTNEDAPCSVCRADAASTVLMIPGRNKCYTGWNMKYNGYLVAGFWGYKKSEYLCLDSSPDVIYGGHTDLNGAVIYSVEGVCGSLPCPPYVNARELTCVVCSK